MINLDAVKSPVVMVELLLDDGEVDVSMHELMAHEHVKPTLNHHSHLRDVDGNAMAETDENNLSENLADG